jgi:hypothetical protein
MKEVYGGPGFGEEVALARAEQVCALREVSDAAVHRTPLGVAGECVSTPSLGAVVCKGTSECVVVVVDVLLNCGELRA